MCRIFGFRSVIQSQVHHSLMEAENALAVQSNLHPDGWGVAYYVADAPHVIKSDAPAVDDHLFKRVSGVVSSETVLAHIRKATLGGNSILNTHPFQFGRWTFIHNGNIKDWDQHKEKLKSLVHPDLKRFILGDTDSETLFMIILTILQKSTDLKGRSVPFNKVTDACLEAINKIVKITGEYSQNDSGPNSDTYLTFVLTNGSTMVAFQGGKHLYYSSYKSKCSERDTCQSFAPECESSTSSGQVKHMIFSSEPLSGENVWIFMNPGDLIGVDDSMKIYSISMKS